MKNQIDRSDANHSRTFDFIKNPRSYDDNLYLFARDRNSSLPPMAINCIGIEFSRTAGHLQNLTF